MTHIITTTPSTQTTNDLINNAIRSLKINITRLREMVLMHPKDYVVVSKDRVHVVQRDGQLAKIAVYPQLPTVFYAGDVAYRIAAGFKAYKGDGALIELEAVKAGDFAQTAIKDLKQRLVDLNFLLETL